nr:EI24 domain-containing protein [Oscillochloris sp. ZM17-4]
MLAGLRYPVRALVMLRRHRELWGFVLIPILLNLVVGVALYAGLSMVGLRQIDQIGQAGGALATTLEFIARVLYVIALAIGVGWLMVRFGVVLGAPWYGQLAGRLEEIITGRPMPETPLTPASVAYDISRALLFELKKLLLAMAIGLPSLLLNLIPAAGTILATAVAVALGALIACLDFFDAPLERHRLRFRAKLGVVRQNLPASASFGLLAAFLGSIPLLNLLAIPLCVTAGTMLVLEGAQDPVETQHAASLQET